MLYNNPELTLRISSFHTCDNSCDQSRPFLRTDIAHPQGWNATRMLDPLLRQCDVAFIPAYCTAHYHRKSPTLSKRSSMFAPQQRGMRLVPLFIVRRAHTAHFHRRIIYTTYSCNPLANRSDNNVPLLSSFFTVRLSRNARLAFTFGRN